MDREGGELAVVVEILAAVGVVVLAAGTLSAFYLGVLGVVGVIRFARCGACGHLAATTASDAPQSCPSCRHETVLHPIVAAHRVQLRHGWGHGL